MVLYGLHNKDAVVHVAGTILASRTERKPLEIKVSKIMVAETYQDGTWKDLSAVRRELRATKPRKNILTPFAVAMLSIRARDHMSLYMDSCCFIDLAKYQLGLKQTIDDLAKKRKPYSRLY